METTKKRNSSRKGNYVSQGIRTDCQNIIKKFGELQTLRYNAFSEIWREMKFSYIYYGHGNLDELIEFTEEVLRIAKEMWLKSEVLNEQAGGLYTLYGLYLKQPTLGWVKVRLTSQDYDLVKKFHEEIKMGDHHDANYILARMHMIGAFRFCISDYSYGLEKAYRRYHENDSTLQEVIEEPFYIKYLKNDDIFDRLNEAFQLYHESKCKLASGNSKKPPKALDYVDSKFGGKLKEQFEKITQENGDDSSKNQEKECDDEQSTSNEKAKNSKPKMPWWLLTVKNRPRRESSSESEPENDADITNRTTEKRKTTDNNTREALNTELGMSGDDEDDDNDNDSNDQSKNVLSSESGYSNDMPRLL